MLWFDRKEVAHFKKEAQKLLKIAKALMERLAKWTDLNCFLSSDRREAHLFLYLFELEITVMLMMDFYKESQACLGATVDSI